MGIKQKQTNSKIEKEIEKILQVSFDSSADDMGDTIKQLFTLFSSVCDDVIGRNTAGESSAYWTLRKEQRQRKQRWFDER